MKNIQKFFAVQLNVGKYNDAEFFAVHHYTHLIALYSVVVALMITSLTIVIGVAENNTTLFFQGCGIGVVAFTFAMTHNTKLVQFFLKPIAKLLFGSKIGSEVTKKKEALNEIYESRNILSEMQSSAKAWQELAGQAKQILHRERMMV